MLSPSRGRSLSDSMDYDDELAELHDNRERQLRMASSTGMGDGRFVQMDTDSDTEDASEDGEGRQDEPQEIKEQVYYDKLALLKAQLEELEAGNHTEYNRQINKLLQEKEERRQRQAVFHEIEKKQIEDDYLNERKLILREFEEKKIELRESLIAELEEKKKQVEMERYSMELSADGMEMKQMSTRKLRRRPNEPVPVVEKRRKPPQSQITFLLEDREIDEDLKAMTKKPKMDAAFKKSLASSSTATASEQSDQPVEHSAPVHLDARIEDGKLFYEKRWFHRGQPVFVEAKDIPRTSGIISGISQDLVWVKKMNEQNKIRVPLTSLQKGKIVIKRRA